MGSPDEYEHYDRHGRTRMALLRVHGIRVPLALNVYLLKTEVLRELN